MRGKTAGPSGFGGSDNDGKAAAILMSHCTTCKNVGVGPLGQLRDLLELISTNPSGLISRTLDATRLAPENVYRCR